MCDLRIASEQAKFGETFVNLGIVPGDGGAYFLPRAIGSQKAAEMIFTGRLIDAQEALAAGIVLKVVPPDRLMPVALELAAEIASKPPHALRLAKMLYRQGMRATNLRDFLDSCAAFQALCHHTADHLEAVRALLERRHGTYSGR
jgi:enoyl-CoA hydratase/carnithine racemase